MHDAERTEIRLLFESDIPAAMKLKDAAGWNQTEADWRRLLMLEPNGCFGAVKNGRLIGTTTTTTYKDDLAWIGMVLVDPLNRHQGIATRLMETALDYLKDKVAIVKLDATSQGKPVYERFGFQVESMVERWIGRPAKSISYKTPSKSLDSEVSPELFELDQQAFLADRSKLITYLIQEAIIPPVLCRSEDGKLNGYATVRRGTKAHYIGPVITTEPDQIENLLDQMLGQLNDSRVYIDVNTECGAPTSVLENRGFVKERDLVRMCYGAPGRKTSPFVVAIAGPEIG